MNIHDNDHDIAADYVLGLVDEPLRQELEQRFYRDPAFAGQVIRWQKALSGIDALTPEVMPAPEVWSRIEREIAHSHRQKAETPITRPPMAYMGWALAAALAGVLVFTYLTRPDGTQTLHPIAVLNGAHPEEQFVVSMNKSTSLLQVSALNVALPENKSLQLWLIKGSQPPRSLGLIAHREGNQFRLETNELDNQSMLAISLEPPGGSKLAGPSGPVIFQGKVSAL
jgi:Uncharacterized protein conserved in bacteria